MREEKQMDYNGIMAQLAQYTRIAEEAQAVIEDLKDKLKEYMKESGIETLTGNEHKATYKAVAQNRIDTTALKKDLPDVAQMYTKTINTMRFTFT